MAPQTLQLLTALQAWATTATNHSPTRLSRELPILWYAQENEQTIHLLESWSSRFPEDLILDFNNGSDLLHFLWNPVAQKPRVVVLEVDAPEPSGVEILQAIRANPALNHLPVALVCKTPPADYQEKGHALGADWCFTLPQDAVQAKAFLLRAHESFDKKGLKHTSAALAA